MPAAKIWTIGHSTRSADEFVSLVRAHDITGLGDIRTIPASRRHPQFGREALDARLREECNRVPPFSRPWRAAQAKEGFPQQRLEERGVPRLRRPHADGSVLERGRRTTGFRHPQPGRRHVRRSCLVAVPPDVAVRRAYRPRRRGSAHHEPARIVGAAAAPAYALRAHRISGRVLSWADLTPTKTGAFTSKVYGGKRVHHSAIRVRGVQVAAMRLRRSGSPHARSWIVGRLARGEGDLLRLDGSRDGPQHRGTVGCHRAELSLPTWRKTSGELGPLARARLGFGLRLADEQHGLSGRRRAVRPAMPPSAGRGLRCGSRTIPSCGDCFSHARFIL